MRNNLPVTGREYDYRNDAVLISATDDKGLIKEIRRVEDMYGAMRADPGARLRESSMRGRGVQLIKLSEGSFVNAMACFDGPMLVVRDGYREARVLAEDFLSHRARKGKHVWPDRRAKMANIVSIGEVRE